MWNITVMMCGAVIRLGALPLKHTVIDSEILQKLHPSSFVSLHQPLW
jgi:hypothetical protein